jgi:tetratricopeptide (TPR) repeat protein
MTALRHNGTIQFNPTYSAAHQSRAMMCGALGRFDEAIDSVSLALQLNPLSLNDRSMGAFVYYQARRYEQDEQELRQILEMDGSFENAYWVLAMVNESQGKSDEAVAAAKRSLELRKGSLGRCGCWGTFWVHRVDFWKRRKCWPSCCGYLRYNTCRRTMLG